MKQTLKKRLTEHKVAGDEKNGIATCACLEDGQHQTRLGETTVMTTARSRLDRSVELYYSYSILV